MSSPVPGVGGYTPALPLAAGSRPATGALSVALARTMRVVLVAALLAAALLLQRTVLPQLPYVPADLLTVVVACIGLAAGPAAGCLAGFAGGLAADLLSDHALGRLAGVLCLVGYLAGLIPARRLVRARVAVPVIALSCGLSAALFAATGFAADDRRAFDALAASRWALGLAYGAALGALAFPILRPVLRRRAGGRAKAPRPRRRTLP